MRSLIHVSLLASLLAPLAWSQDSLDSPTASLRFETTISRSPIALGDTATLFFRVHNLTSNAITLRFASTCQILPIIINQQTGERVYPTGGLPVCGAMVTYLTIPALGETSMLMRIRGRAATDPAHRQVLAPGDYIAYAALASYSLRPDTLSFSVR